MSFRLGVTEQPCEFPLIDMTDNGCDTDEMCTEGVKDIYKSQAFTTTATVTTDCSWSKGEYFFYVHKVSNEESS